VKKGLPTLPSNTPGELKKIVAKCWSPNPADRGSFGDFIQEDANEKTIWDAIFKEAELQSDTVGQEIWKDACAGGNNDSVPWNKFEAVFFKHMNIPVEKSQDKTQLRVKCLQALMNLGFNINDDHTLPHKNFSDFVKLFKPLRSGPEGLSFVDSLVDLCKKDYFFGYIGRDCEALLNKVFLPQKDDKKKSPFHSSFVFLQTQVFPL